MYKVHNIGQICHISAQWSSEMNANVVSVSLFSKSSINNRYLDQQCYAITRPDLESSFKQNRTWLLMIIRDNRLGQRSLQSSLVFSSQKIILFFPPFVYLLNHVYPFVFSPSLFLSHLPPYPILCLPPVVCVCWYPIPNPRLRWAASANAEDQGEAWDCIREVSGLYVLFFSSHFHLFLAFCPPLCFPFVCPML